MPLPTKTILGILSDNLAKRGSVLPLSAAAATGWAKGLEIPQGGETILYTGHMYQLIPSISAMAGDMAKMEDSWITKFSEAGRIANKLVNLSSFMAMKVSDEDQAQCDSMLRNIATLLTRAGIEFGYLYENEMYTGTLAYDEGMDEVFAKHAAKVTEGLRKNGVRKVITVDPHTTNILREVYPQVVEGFDIEVVSWLEALTESGFKPAPNGAREVVIHDSCVYARYEDVIDSPRQLLADAGVTVKEPANAGKATFCCGGPIESLFPGKAHEISLQRIAQLGEAGNCVTTMCPICWINLRKAAGPDMQVRDISDVLIEADSPG